MGLPTKTKWEDKLFAFIVLDGLPVPKRNCVGVIAGRKFEFDLYWPDHKVAVEVQGGTWARNKMGHGTGVGIARDCEKIILSQLQGIIILPVTSDHIRDGRAMQWIHRAMTMRKHIGET